HRVEYRPNPGLIAPIQTGAVQLTQHREPLKELFLNPQVTTLVPGNDPGGGTLEHIELVHFRGNFRYILDRAASSADGHHLLVGQVIVMIPASGVEHLALELVQSRNVGYGGHMQDRKSTRLNSSHVQISYA